MSVPLAHAGHWLVNVAYVAPLLVLAGFVGVAKVRDMRAERREEQPED